MQSDRKYCSRCTAVEGAEHPINKETVTLEAFTMPNGTVRIVCTPCAFQLESKYKTKSPRRGFLSAIPLLNWLVRKSG